MLYELMLSLLAYWAIRMVIEYHKKQKTTLLLVGMLSLYVFFNLWLSYYYQILGEFFEEFNLLLNALPVVAVGAIYYIDGQKRRAIDYFSKYVDEKIVGDLLKKDIKLGGEKRYVVVVFTDVRGFTAMSERLSPEEVVEILNGHFDVITEESSRFGATLLKFIGDAAMLAFNVPLRQEMAEKKAVDMCISIINDMKDYSKSVAKKYGVDFSIGIGICGGEAVVGNIGSSKQMDYTLIGDVVNTASRLNGVAGPWEIVVEEETAKRAGVKAPLDEAKVKGKKRSVKFVRLKP